MQTQLLKSYLRNVLIFSERLNLNYYVKLTEDVRNDKAETLKKLNEMIYDNASSVAIVKLVNESYQRLAPYIDNGNLKVAENMKSLVSDAIEFLIEDVKNITKLGTVENADVIKEFSLNNIERLRKILLVI